MPWFFAEDHKCYRGECPNTAKVWYPLEQGIGTEASKPYCMECVPELNVSKISTSKFEDKENDEQLS